MPEPLTISIAGGIISSLAANMLQNAGVKLRKAIRKSGQEEALRRCTQAGVAAFLGVIKTNSQEEIDHLDTIFRAFFEKPDVAEELAMLLEGELPDEEALLKQFEQAGFIAEQLPGLDFEVSMSAFQQTFIASAAGEGELAGNIQALNLIKQSKIQNESLETLKQISAVLKSLKEDTLQMASGKITGSIAETGQEGGVDFTQQLRPYFSGMTSENSSRSVTIGGDVQKSIIITGDRAKVDAFFNFGNYYATSNEATASEDNSTATRVRYLNSLINHCQTLPLAALGENVTLKEEITLDKVYVGLDTTTMQELTDSERKVLSEKSGREIEKDAKRPTTALEAAEGNDRLVLLGDPGAGKSTFAKQLCVQLATAALERGDEVSLPVFINLRDLAAKLKTDSLKKLSASDRTIELRRLMTEQIQRSFAELESEEFGETFLKGIQNAKCLLVLDGLDEVPFDKRESMRDLVGESCAYFKLQKLLITCRVRSYSDASHFDGFASYTLAPFNADKIRNFIRGWYLAQQSMGRIVAAQIEDKIEDLAKAALEGSLKEIAGNPMLLTTMSIIHQRDIGLPDRRVELYKLAVEVLLHRWREHQAGDQLGISDELRDFLRDDSRLRPMIERLAYEAHRPQLHNQYSGSLDRGTALVLLGDNYLGGVDLADQFLDYIDQHSGLFVGESGEPGRVLTYGFPHRTFQEYLAGCYLVSQRDLVRQILFLAEEGDYWSTALQLGFEELRYNRRSDNQLLDLAYQLCSSESAKTAVVERQHLWSSNIAKLLGTQKIEQDKSISCGGAVYLKRIRAALVNRLSGSLPSVERMQAGNNLALLGDPRLGITTVDGIEFCYVPEGPFGYRDRESPSLLSVYWLSRYPISNAQYNIFIKEKGYKNPNYWEEAIDAKVWNAGVVKGRYEEKASAFPRLFREEFNYSNRPQVGVSWYEAIAFCRWLTELSHKKKWLSQDLRIDLPTEFQWEKSALGGRSINNQAIILPLRELRENETETLLLGAQKNPMPHRLYPWGEKVDANVANCRQTGVGTTSSLGCFPKGMSPVGCEEMSGNVWEWCQSKFWGGGRLGAAKDGRVLRGGSWLNHDFNLRCSYPYFEYPDLRKNFIGFRVGVFPVGGQGRSEMT
ncbi:MAG: SUMF1/EgtB/PvdO family nonheme iron enzyme [Calditrichia bacterium]